VSLRAFVDGLIVFISEILFKARHENALVGLHGFTQQLGCE